MEKSTGGTLDAAAKARVFGEVVGMAGRWAAFWQAYSAAPSRNQMRDRPLLAGAIAAFLIAEFDNHPALRQLEADSELRYPMALAFVAKAVPLSKTHDEGFVLDTLALMGVGKSGTRLPAGVALWLHRKGRHALQTKGQRLALLAIPVLGVPLVNLFTDEFWHGAWSPSAVSLALLTAIAICAAYAFTGVGKWVVGE